MLEKELEAKVVKYAKDHGILTYKFVSPNNRGVPDRIFLFNGYTMFMELKAAGKKPTTLQLREHKRIQEKGFYVAVVDSFEAATQHIRLFQQLP